MTYTTLSSLIGDSTYDLNNRVTALAAAGSPVVADTPNTVCLRDSSGRSQMVDPAAAQDIATKNYVDNTAGVVSNTASTLMRRDSSARAQVSDPAAAQDIATKNYVDNTAGTSLNTYSALMRRDASGNVNVSTPTTSTQAATKGYVDSAVAGTGGTSQAINNLGSGITLTSTSPRSTIFQAKGHRNGSVILPNASTCVGQTFTVSRDGTSGQGWQFPYSASALMTTTPGTNIFVDVNTTNTTTYALNPSTGELKAITNSSWTVATSATITTSGITYTGMYLSSDNTTLYICGYTSSGLYVYSYSASALTLSSTYTVNLASVSTFNTYVRSADRSTFAISWVTAGNTYNYCFTSGVVTSGFTTLTGNIVLAVSSTVAVSLYSGTLQYSALNGSGLASGPSSSGTLLSLQYNNTAVLCNNYFYGVLANGTPYALVAFNTSTGATITPSASLTTSGTFNLSCDATNNLIYVSYLDNVVVLDAPTGKVLRTVRLPQGTTYYNLTNRVLAYNADGAGGAVISFFNGSITQIYLCPATNTTGSVNLTVSTQSSQQIDNYGTSYNLPNPNDTAAFTAYQDSITSAYAWAVTTPVRPLTVASLCSKFAQGQIEEFTLGAYVVQMSDGTLWGWGDNTAGCLCNGTQAAGTSQPQPLMFDPNNPPNPGTTIVDWAFCQSNTYVVLSDGTLWGGGLNASGQLGQGNTTALPYLTRIGTYTNVTKVWCHTVTGSVTNAVMYFATSALQLYGVGYNANSALGNGGTTNLSTPYLMHTFSSTGVTQLSIGDCYTAINVVCVGDGNMWVSGYNALGQMGTAGTSNVTTLTQISPTGYTAGTALKVISQGGYNGSARTGNIFLLTTTGSVFVCGTGTYGQLGTGSTTSVTSFVQSSTSLTYVTGKITDIKVGGGYECHVMAVIGATGTVYSWGANVLGGNFAGSTSNATTPTQSSFEPMTLIDKCSTIAAISYAQTIMICSNGNMYTSSANAASNGFPGLVSQVYTPYTTSSFIDISLFPTPPRIRHWGDAAAQMHIMGQSAAYCVFVLTNAGELWAYGTNTGSKVSFGESGATNTTSNGWTRLVIY